MTDTLVRALEIVKRRQEIRAEKQARLFSRYQRLLKRRHAPKPRDAERIAFLIEKLAIAPDQVAEHAAAADRS